MGDGMVTSTQLDELIAEWEEWLAFLQERPELEGFEWARHLAR
jgi:hypothetical protein